LPRYFSTSLLLRGRVILFLDSYSTYVLILVVNFELQPGPVLAGFLQAFRITDVQTNTSSTFTACFQQLTNSYLILSVTVALCFHEVTNPLFDKPLPFMQIQTAPGVGGSERKAKSSTPAFHGSSIPFKIISLRYITT
jgi:hypothetical protein